MEMRVLMMVGAPGSGKSSWSRRRVQMTPGAMRLSLDDLRVALWGSKRAYWDAPDIDVRKATLRAMYGGLEKLALISAPPLLILDNTHIEGWAGDGGQSYAVSKTIENLAEAGIEPKLVVMHTSLENLIYRNSIARPEDDRVPIDLVTAAYNNHESPDAWWRSWKGAKVEFTT